jgi:hypothetical protein
MQQQDSRDNVFRHALSGGLAEERGFDYLSEVKRGIGHWYADHYVSDRDYLGRDAVVEMRAKPLLLSYRSFFSMLTHVIHMESKKIVGIMVDGFRSEGN